MDLREISVIVPTYNRLAYLQTAINSIINQQLVPHTLIIGDDSNDDLTENWVKQEQHNWPFATRYQHNKPGLGQADNVEDLIQRVRTPYLLLLHDDDALEPNALQDLYAEMQKGEADVVFGKQYIIDKDDQVDLEQSEILNRNYLRTPTYAGTKLDPIEVALNQQLPSNSFLIKSSIAQEVHYNFKEESGDAVDFYFCLNLALQEVLFVFIDTYISSYRVSNDSISSNSNAGYYSFSIVEKLVCLDNNAKQARISFLNEKCPVAIMEALNMGKTDKAKAMCFSKYHRKKLFTLGGLKRLAMALGFIKK